MKSVAFDHNAYWGAISGRPADSHAVTADPLNTASLRRAGKVIAGNGGRDFWGNPLPVGDPPDIGAVQGTQEKPVLRVQRRGVLAGVGRVPAGMTGSQVRRLLGTPTRITVVPVLNSRHFYQVWRYPSVTVTLDEHDRVLNGRP